MRVAGKVCKSRKDQFWLCTIPILDLMVQAETKEEIPEMVKDAIELLVDDVNFNAHVTLSGNIVFISSEESKKLVALMLKRQRQKHGLTLEQVAALLNTKSINDYAQYEQGKHVPSLDNLTRFLEAINPSIQPFISCPS
ncbi:helix-turn-helix transcriptional regulator [Candidatus Dependentiae bacterium]|nr:helix-turn-helix transcriptional regulator [Candidatus Dependentiae bacterium]